MKIDGFFVDLIESLIKTSYASKEQKAVMLADVSIKLDTLKFFIHLAWDMKILDHKKYSVISSPLHEIGRMIGGWKKSVQ